MVKIQKKINFNYNPFDFSYVYGIDPSTTRDKDKKKTAIIEAKIIKCTKKWRVTRHEEFYFLDIDVIINKFIKRNSCFVIESCSVGRNVNMSYYEGVGFLVNMLKSKEFAVDRISAKTWKSGLGLPKTQDVTYHEKIKEILHYKYPSLSIADNFTTDECEALLLLDKYLRLNV